MTTDEQTRHERISDEQSADSDTANVDASSTDTHPAASVWSRPGSAVILPAPPRVSQSNDDVDGVGDGGRGGLRAARSIVSGAAMAIAAFAFAFAQAIGGLVAGPVASVIPGAADSPANHLRIIAVIYIGMGCAAAVLAALALRRAGDDADAPRWATYLAGAAVAVSALVVLQALLLAVLSTLAPD